MYDWDVFMVDSVVNCDSAMPQEGAIFGFSWYAIHYRGPTLKDEFENILPYIITIGYLFGPNADYKNLRSLSAKN